MLNNPFKSSLQKFLSVTHPPNHPRNQGSSGLLDVLIYFEQGEEEVEEKTLEVLSREAAEFLDEKPSHKRFFHFSFLRIYPHTNYLRKVSVLSFAITCNSSILFWFAPFSFQFCQVCQHLGRDHNGFGSIHLWILLLDRQEHNISISYLIYCTPWGRGGADR